MIHACRDGQYADISTSVLYFMNWTNIGNNNLRSFSTDHSTLKFWTFVQTGL